MYRLILLENYYETHMLCMRPFNFNFKFLLFVCVCIGISSSSILRNFRGRIELGSKIITYETPKILKCLRFVSTACKSHAAC